MTIRVCWTELPNGRTCAGTVAWTKAAGRWRSYCPKCGASGFAAAGETAALEREEVGHA